MNAEQIKMSLFSTANDKKEIYIKETNSTLYVGKINVAQTTKIAELEKEDKSVDGLIYIIIENCYDKEGNKIFTLHDWDSLNKLPFSILKRIADEIREFSLDDEDIEELKKK